MKKTYRKDIKTIRERAKTIKTKKSRTTKMYAICKADRASKSTQNGNSNDELINGAIADTITPVDIIDNIEIVAKNVAKLPRMQKT